MQSLIVDNMNKIRALWMTHNVKALFAFGSVCTDAFNDQSDVDLLISLKKWIMGIMQILILI